MAFQLPTAAFGHSHGDVLPGFVHTYVASAGLYVGLKQASLGPAGLTGALTADSAPSKTFRTNATELRILAASMLKHVHISCRVVMPSPRVNVHPVANSTSCKLLARLLNAGTTRLHAETVLPAAQSFAAGQ